MRKITLSIIAIATAIGAQAVAAGFAWSPARTITSIELSGGANVVTLDGAQIVPGSSCTNKFRIPANDPDGADKMETLTYADSNALSVKVSYLSTSTACEVYLADVEVIEP